MRTVRFLPILILTLTVTIAFKTANLIESAFAQSTLPVPAAAPADLPSQDPNGSSAKSPSTQYRPVSNWTDRPPPPPMCRPDPLTEAGESSILLHLKARELALNDRAAALNREQQELDATKAALRHQVAALKPLAQRLEAMKSASQSADDAKWASLVATYGAMDPRSAARIFDGLDPTIVFNVLRRMNDRKSAAILAGMSPATAQAITERLAGDPPPPVQSANALLPDGAP
jgi:flagellar motility protein MotE (MotC chaperone)